MVFNNPILPQKHLLCFLSTFLEALGIFAFHTGYFMELRLIRCVKRLCQSLNTTLNRSITMLVYDMIYSCFFSNKWLTIYFFFTKNILFCGCIVSIYALILLWLLV